MNALPAFDLGSAARAAPRAEGVLGGFVVAAGPGACELLRGLATPLDEHAGRVDGNTLVHGAARIASAGSRQLAGLFDLVAGDAHGALADGQRAWQQWRGRFAFAAVERGGAALLAATDHLGTLPLYFTGDGTRMLVASDLRLLLRAPWVVREVDPQALFHYLNFSYVPAPLTIVPTIRRLAPGSLLRWDGASGVAIERWWRPSYPEQRNGDERELSVQLRERIEATVVRYRPDGEDWGCFLSGGTDSSSISGILARRSAQPVRTYSIGFAERGYDELEFAQLAATHFGTAATFGQVDKAQTLAALPRLAEWFDQPQGNASAVPTQACAALAAAHGRSVLVAGDGGDEIFGGNERYAKDRVMAAFHALPSPLKRIARAAGALLGGGNWHFGNRVANFTRRASLANPERCYTDDAFASECFDSLLTPALASRLQPDLSLRLLRSVYGATAARAELHRLMALDLELAVAQNDLMKVNGGCAAHGIAARYPYLDPDLVEYCGSLPARFKLRGLRKRYLFRKAMAGLLPDAILDKRKQGFGLPIAVWMREERPFRELIHDLLLSRRARERGWFEAGFVTALLERHARGGWDHSAQLWQLAVLELWLRRNLDAD